MDNKKRWVSILAAIMAAMLLLGLIASVLPAPASAASSSEIKKQLEEMKKEQSDRQKEIDSLEQQVSDNMSKMQKLVDEKSVIDQQIGLLYQQVAGLNEQIAAYGLLIADLQDELDAARDHLQTLSEQNRERIRAMEEDGTLSYWSVLFEANSFSDLLDRLTMIEEIAAADRRRLQEMSAAAEAVAAAQAGLEAEKAVLVETKAEIKVTQTELEGKREKTDALLIELNALGEEYEAYIEEQEKIMNELSKDIAKKKEEYDEAKESEYWKAYWATYVPPTTAPPTTRPSNSQPTVVPPASVVNGLTWITPIRFTMLTSPYGMRLHPIYKVWRMHTGVDLAAPMGRDIVATRGGKVITATYNNSYGYYVVVDHGDGFTSLYAHMTHYVVSVGDTVAAGAKLGECGSTGASTGPHLHFEILYNGSTVNPVDYIKT